MAATVPTLQRQFSSSNSLPRKMQGMICEAETMYFVRMKSNDPIKIRNAEIQEKLADSSFDKLNFYDCTLSKAYKTTFNWLIRHHRPISQLEMNLIPDMNSFLSLVEFLASTCCVSLRKLAICPSVISGPLGPLMPELLDTIFSSQSPIECLQLQCISIQSNIRMDKAFASYIQTATVQSHILRILDFRRMPFYGRQTTDMSLALLHCLSDKRELSQRNTGSMTCSISHLVFGGNDQWTLRGVEAMCNFIKFNHNLECVGVDLLNDSVC